LAAANLHVLDHALEAADGVSGAATLAEANLVSGQAQRPTDIDAEATRHRRRNIDHANGMRFGFFHVHDGENLWLWNMLKEATLARLPTKVERRLH
jgi:hypothetical protein